MDKTDFRMTLKEKLMHIQEELKAPKNLKNTFGGYNYRSAENILEALKPLLVKYGATVTITDNIEEIGGRIYVKSTATIWDTDSTSTYSINSNGIEVSTADALTVTAYAREAETKKGMDDAQVTGATSSYARKYALNGLFLLDDTEDVDSEAYQAQAKPEPQKAAPKKAPAKKAEPKKEEPKEVPPLTEEELLFLSQRYSGENLEKLLDYFKIEDISQIEPAAGRALIKKIQEQKKKKAEG